MDAKIERIKRIKRTKPIKQDEIVAANGEEGNKPLASISLDLDNKWTYMKTHGDLGWESFPSYLNTFIPMVLNILDQLNLKITFFIVGQDAALDENREVLKLITENGHEVGNHSLNHEVWLHQYSKDKIKREILEAEEHIYRATGQKPVGFRGPGFSWSSKLLEILGEIDYLYDASILPTFLGPLARAYYFWKSNLSEEEKEQRKKLYGSFKDGLQPIKPYFIQLASDIKLLEIPVTTMPIFKAPFHLSYLIYLSRFSELLMISYLRIAVTLCRITRTTLSFLLHPLDFLDSKQVPELAFFPGMDLSHNRKLEVFNEVIQTLSKRFNLVNMSNFAKFIMSQNEIKVVKIPSILDLKQSTP